MPPINIVTVGNLTDSKVARTYAKHSVLYSTKIQNAWRFTYRLPTRLNNELVKYKNNLYVHRTQHIKAHWTPMTNVLLYNHIKLTTLSESRT